MAKTTIIISLVAIFSIIFALWAFTSGPLSLTSRTLSNNQIEWDTGQSCVNTQDCFNTLDGFPSNGYCADGTCRFVEAGVVKNG
jgi:hypothetical protein